MKGLEHIADQRTVDVRGLKDAALEQDSRLALAMQRVFVLEQRLQDVEDVQQKAAQTAESFKTDIVGHIKQMQDDGDAWQKTLDGTTKEQNANFQSKLDEAAATFIKCDGILGQIKEAQPLYIPAAAGPVCVLVCACV